MRRKKTLLTLSAFTLHYEYFESFASYVMVNKLSVSNCVMGFLSVVDILKIERKKKLKKNVSRTLLILRNLR